MSFYRSNQAMHFYLKEVIAKFSLGNHYDLDSNLSLTWVYYGKNVPKFGSGLGAGINENKLFYPASVVKLIYGIAAEIWIQNDFLVESEELRRALNDMITYSSNDATSYVVDLLTGTNSGPSLDGENLKAWEKQRYFINNWLRSLNWIELNNINCCQKTWSEGPYGREKDFYGENNKNRNALTSKSVAKLMEGLMTDFLMPNQSSKDLKKYLSRTLNKEFRKNDPENQIDGFLGEGLLENTKFWSKAGWMSSARNDAAWWTNKDNITMLVVIFTSGKDLSKDINLLPSIAHELNNFYL